MEEQPLSSKEIIGKEMINEMRELESTFTQLVEDLDKEGEYIQEDVFLSRWLRGLVTEKTIPVVNAWVELVAKTPQTQVYIVRDGEVVNTFPPLVAAAGTTRTEYEAIRSINTVSNAAIVDSDMTPQNGQSILLDYVGAVVPDGEYNEKWLPHWNKLVKDYGYPEYVITTTAEVEAQEKTPTATSGSIKAESDDEYEML